MPAGFTSQAGIARENIVYQRTWPGTPVAITRLLSLLDEDVQTTLDQTSLVTLESKSTPVHAIVTRQHSPGSIRTYLQYEGSELFFLSAMGQEAVRIDGVQMPEELEVGVYRRLIEVDRDVNQSGWIAGDGFIAGSLPTGDGIVAKQQKVRSFTYAILKNNQVWETHSCLVDNLQVQGNPQNGVVLSADIVGYDTSYNTTLVNGSIGTLTRNNERALYQQSQVYMRPKADGPITSDNLVDCSGWQFRIANNLSILNTRETGTKIEEPQRGGGVVITGGIALPRWQIADFFGTNYANESLAIKIVCQSPNLIGTSYFPTITFYFPNVILTGAEAPVSGEAQIVQNYSFLALGSADVENFPTSTKQGPLMVETVSTDGTHLLLD